MKMKIIVSIIIFFCSINLSISQDIISGIINSYTKVLDLRKNKTMVVVSDLDIFVAGDMALIIQMKGAEIDTNNTDKFGNIIEINEAGNYEFVIIKEQFSSIVEFENPLCREYDINGKVQLIKVPVLGNVVVNDKLTAKKWDGSTGGVLALALTGTLSLNGDIDVSGLGFEGGELQNSSWECDQLDYYYPLTSWKGAQKGEGIAILGNDKLAGRGAIANGGGGGNCTNAGGAGGGNFGKGGHGGKQFMYECDSTDIGGLSGYNMNYSNDINKIFIGGGGGAGHQNDGAGSKGGNGGGIVIIHVKGAINGNNNKIIADGSSAFSSLNDGAGGGGAGGAIILLAEKYDGNLTLSNVGGNGGNCNVGDYEHCYGPGGGGGGGCIWINNKSIPNNVNCLVSGGKNGIITNSLSPCYLSNYGTEEGEEGGVITDLDIQVCCDETLFNYPDFNSVNNLLFINDCKKTDSTITITPSLNWNSGAVWYAEKIPVKNGFTTEFSFRFSEGLDKYVHEDFPGADGIAFVIQDNSATAIGSSGGGLGYNNIPNCFAIEYDTYKNSKDISENLEDPNENHIAVFCNGINKNTSIHGSSANLATSDKIFPLIPDGRIFYSRIDYMPDDFLRVYLDTTKNFELPAIIEIKDIDISKLLALDSAEFSWVGFTSATGNAYEKHELMSWSMCPKPSNIKYIDVEENAKLTTNTFVIYPNPANDFLNIEYKTNNSSVVSLEIYDVLGNKIYSIQDELNDNDKYYKQIPVNNCSSGLYYIIMRTNDNIFSEKFTIIN